MGCVVVVAEAGAARSIEGAGALAEARAALARGAPLVWIDLDGRTPEAEALLAGELGLHRLTLEDLWEERETPKAEAFPGYLYVLAHAAALPAEAGRGPAVEKARTTEVDLVLGERWLLTHHHGVPAVAGAREALLRRPETLQRGPAVALHAVLDRLVDGLLPLVDAFDAAIEALEAEALRKRPPRSTLPRLLAVRRALHRLRRSSVHQREVLLKLGRGDFAQIPRDSLPFFRDVHDHQVRLADLLDDDRELLTAVLEAWLSMTSNRMNEIMKVLTLISTVMLPLTFIVGVYGMNFEFMPELHWRWGYPAVWAVMAVTTGALLWGFQRRGWFK